MDSGRTYVFRYAVAGNRFRIECYTSAETLEDPVFDDYFDGGAGGSGYTGALPKPLDGTLPAGITFVASQSEAETYTTSIDSDATSSYAMEDDWSEPILFYPDGTTSTAVLLLQNQYNRCVELSLRGLTGTVDIGEIYAAEGPFP